MIDLEMELYIEKIDEIIERDTMLGFLALLLLIGLLLFGRYNIVNTKNKAFKTMQIVLMVLMLFSVMMFVLTLIKPINPRYKNCLHGVLLSSYEYAGEDDAYYVIHYSAFFDRYTYCIEKSSSKKSALVSKGSLVNVFYNTEAAKPHQGRTMIKDALIKLDPNFIFLIAGMVFTGVFCAIQAGFVMYYILKRIKK